MKRWIHAREEIQSFKKPIKISASKNTFNAKAAFNHFKSKYPKAYEVLGK